MMHLTKIKIVIGLTAIAALAPAVEAQVDAAKQPIARIGNQTIDEKDLLPLIGAQLLQLRHQEYELKMKALVNVLNQRLLESEAKKKGLSIEAFLAEAVDKNVPPAGAAELEAYYLAQKDRLGQPFDQAKPQLERAFAQARRQQARQAYMDRLRQEAGVSILLTRPTVEVTADPARLRGDPDAPVLIVEFADFQCSYCQVAAQTLKEVMNNYKGKVRLGFRDFPLRQIHPQAQQAAEASRCAGEGGKFWEYHDLLFANPAALDAAALRERAQTVGLDVQRFDACLASGKFRPLIENDLQAGGLYGVSGTPAFFINGKLLAGAQPVAAFERAIDAALAEAESKKASR